MTAAFTPPFGFANSITGQQHYNHHDTLSLLKRAKLKVRQHFWGSSDAHTGADHNQLDIPRQPTDPTQNSLQVGSLLNASSSHDSGTSSHALQEELPSPPGSMSASTSSAHDTADMQGTGDGDATRDSQALFADIQHSGISPDISDHVSSQTASKAITNAEAVLPTDQQDFMGLGLWHGQHNGSSSNSTSSTIHDNDGQGSASRAQNLTATEDEATDSLVRITCASTSL